MESVTISKTEYDELVECKKELERLDVEYEVAKKISTQIKSGEMSLLDGQDVLK